MNHADPLPDEIVELIAQRFHALGEPMRLKLLDRLRQGEANVLELTELLATTPQNASKHLGILHRLGIVRRRKDGNFSYYSIADDSVFGLCEIVCGSIEQQLEGWRGTVSAAGSARPWDAPVACSVVSTPGR
jgi:ArsR family transcriptional regulator